MSRKRKTYRRLDYNTKEFDRAVEVMQALGCDECYRRLMSFRSRKTGKIKEVMRLDGSGPLMAQVWPDKYSVCGWRVVCDPCSERIEKGR